MCLSVCSNNSKTLSLIIHLLKMATPSFLLSLDISNSALMFCGVFSPFCGILVWSAVWKAPLQKCGLCLCWGPQFRQVFSWIFSAQVSAQHPWCTFRPYLQRCLGFFRDNTVFTQGPARANCSADPPPSVWSSQLLPQLGLPFRSPGIVQTPTSSSFLSNVYVCSEL